MFFFLQNGAMTGVLVQCTSRIPLSYRRKAKTPPERGFRICQIVAYQRCYHVVALPSMNTLNTLLAHFQYLIHKIARLIKNDYPCSASSFRDDKKTFALKISRHHLTRLLASLSVNQGAIFCNSRVMSEIFFRVV